MKKDRSKLLIPCFRDMDAYELPEEFAHLQAQNMAKIGFINDVVRGIRKVIVKDEPAAAAPAAAPVSGSIAAYLKRAAMCLEDGDWAKADQFCEEVLNIDPENALAYLYKLMADLRVSTRDQLENVSNPFSVNANCKKAMRFGDQQMQEFLQSALEKIRRRNEIQQKNKIYIDASRALNSAKTEQDFRNAASIFQQIPGWDDADEKAAEALAKADEAHEAAKAAHFNQIYQNARVLAERDDSVSLREAIEQFQSIQLHNY
jgi:hypothetical protein